MSKVRPTIIWLSLVCSAALGLEPALSAAPGEADGTFAETLRAAGWEVGVFTDGSLELRPGGQTQTQASGPRQARATARDDPGTSAWEALRDYGWRVVTARDGTTLLFPPGATNSTEAQLSTSAPPPASAELARDLNALLAERGWRVKRAADGALRWFPLRRTSSPEPTTAQEQKPGPEVAEPQSPSRASSDEAPPPAQAPAPSRQATDEAGTMTCGFLPAEIRSGRIALPIDGLFKASIVARSWLYAKQDSRLRAGRIRWFGRGFLIDIVEATRPRLVRHQLVVSTKTGRVTVL